MSKYIMQTMLALALLAGAEQRGVIRPPDLRGVWLDTAAGLEVRITQTGDEVTAEYLEERTCANSKTKTDFTGRLENRRIVGQMTSCKFGSSNDGYVWAPIEMGLDGAGKLLVGHWVNESAGRNVFISFKKLDDEPDAACRDPLSWSVSQQDYRPFSRATPADVAPGCGGCTPGMWQYKSGTISWKAGRIDGPDRCIYEFEATWECTTTGGITKTRKHRILDGLCGAGSG